MSEFEYVGTELELFAVAQNWKNYVNHLIRDYIKGNVLEVGAGIGKNTLTLCSTYHDKWLCLEPDEQLFEALKNSINIHGMHNCYPQNGTIKILTKEQLFDSILYLDVLEHIREDKEEIIQVTQHLKNKGHLIILAPAYQFLFTSFDAAIGHYRRYDKQNILRILPDSIKVIKLIYLDCVGLLASLGNKLILQKSQPTLQQIKLWDELMVPASKILDAMLGYQLGKSILLIGEKRC